MHGLRATSAYEPNPDDPKEAEMYKRYLALCTKLQMPPKKVYMYEGKYPNAACLSNGTVVVHKGLLQKLTPDEMEGVIGHELTHRRRFLKDMVIGGTLNLSIMIGTQIAAYKWVLRGAIDRMKQRFHHRPQTFETVMELLSIAVAYAGALVTSICTAPWRKHVEYEADKGGAELTGKPEALSSGLDRLKEMSDAIRAEEDAKKPEWLKALRKLEPQNIRDFRHRLTASHPLTEHRKTRLEKIAQERSAAQNSAASI